MAVSISEKTEFLSFFYFRSMSVLLTPLMANTTDGKLARDDFHLAQLQNLILDFVTFCVEHHTYHMRNFLNKKDLLRRVLVLLKSKHQFLQLSTSNAWTDGRQRNSVSFQVHFDFSGRFSPWKMNSIIWRLFEIISLRRSLKHLKSTNEDTISSIPPWSNCSSSFDK